MRASASESSSMPSPSSLSEWMRECGLAVDSYGVGRAKTITDLHREVEAKECVLQEMTSPARRLMRHVSVLNVYLLRDPDLVLMEDSQVLPDGRVRTRHLPLAEKLIGDEQWDAAVYRAVSEELGSVLPLTFRLEVDPASYRVDVTDEESHSYPGLLTRYTCHRVDARLPDLPHSDAFASVEPRPEGVLTTNWRWVPRDELRDNGGRA